MEDVLALRVLQVRVSVHRIYACRDPGDMSAVNSAMGTETTMPGIKRSPLPFVHAPRVGPECQMSIPASAD